MGVLTGKQLDTLQRELGIIPHDMIGVIRTKGVPLSALEHAINSNRPVL